MDSQRYMLDTNTASYIIKGKPQIIRERLLNVPMASVCISAITEAELLHGVARKPEAKKLPVLVNEFLLRIAILPWDSLAASTYAQLRATCERQGVSLGAMDMLIAAHAVASKAVLISSDKAFTHLKPRLLHENWAL